MSELWLCGKFVKETDKGTIWEFQGIFDDKQKAIKACVKEEYFIAPIKLNEKICHERKKFSSCEYPLLEGGGNV